jgi:hypothetical protein
MSEAHEAGTLRTDGSSDFVSAFPKRETERYSRQMLVPEVICLLHVPMTCLGAKRALSTY